MKQTKPAQAMELRSLSPVFDGPNQDTGMTGQPTMRPSQESSFPDRAFACLPYISLLGLALLVANIALSFEEPHWAMLTVAALLLLTAPVGILMHMTITSEITPAERRMWLSALAGRKGPSLFAAYFSRTDRARATRMLVSLHRNET